VEEEHRAVRRALRLPTKHPAPRIRVDHLQKEARERGAEPDECYLVGRKLADYPEIVLEVICSSPLLDKLEVYAAMGVAEVWVFRERRFTIHALDRGAERYVVATGSALVPGRDFDVLARYALREDTPEALHEFATEIG
jgi:Uma2 family endonuclease